MANLDLYNAVRTVPQEAQKGFNNGSFSGTDINPMWRIKTLTEHFGKCGVGWWIDEVERWTESYEGEQLVFVKIHLYIKEDGEWSKPIVGIGGNKTVQQFSQKKKVSDESYKMAYTDAISVACKALGFGADIYWQNDPTKYTQYYTENQGQAAPQTTGRGHKKAEPAPAPAPAPEPAPVPVPQNPNFEQTVEFAINQVALVNSTEELNAVWGRFANLHGRNAAFIKAIQASPFHPNNIGK